MADRDNVRAMKAASRNFSDILSDEQQHDARVDAVLYAIRTYRPGKYRTLAGSLKRLTRLYCLVEMERAKRWRREGQGGDVGGAAAPPDDRSHEILESLPPELRDIVVLKVLHRMTFREIASRYPCGYYTIQRRYRKAMKILRGVWMGCSDPHSTGA